MKSILTVAAVAALASNALADLTVTDATVHHSFSWEGGMLHAAETIIETPLNGSAPGNSFSTLNQNSVPEANGKLGLTSALDTNGGFVRADAFISGDSADDRWNSAINGSLLFTVPAGELSFGSNAAASNGNLAGDGVMELRHLSTNQSWRVNVSPDGPPTFAGDLFSPAPAGDYELTWSLLANLRRTGIGGAASVGMDLSVVPEPSTLAMFLAAGGCLMRRRR